MTSNAALQNRGPEERLRSHKELLFQEKQLTGLRDEVSRQRCELPWVKVEKEYVFDVPLGERHLQMYLTLPNGQSHCVATQQDDIKATL